MEDQIILDRLKKAFQSIDGTSIHHQSCPDPEKIWDAQKGVLDREETHAIIDHTSGCGACAQAWRVALEISEPQETLVADNGSGKIIKMPWMVPGTALAIAALLMLAFALQFKGDDAEFPADINFRDSTEVSEIRSLLPREEALPRSGFELTWEHSLEGNTSYDIQVQSQDLEVIAQASRLMDPQFALTSDMLKNQKPGSRILWQVIVRIDDVKTKWSPTFVNVVE